MSTSLKIASVIIMLVFAGLVLIAPPKYCNFDAVPGAQIAADCTPTTKAK